MNIENMFTCIDAYTANFCNVEDEKEFIRFSDEQLPDMYDHNFILLRKDLELASMLYIRVRNHRSC